MKWRQEGMDEGFYWEARTAVGAFTVGHAPWLGGWVLSWYPMDHGDCIFIGKARKSAAGCKRRARKFIRKLAGKLRAELGE